MKNEKRSGDGAANGGDGAALSAAPGSETEATRAARREVLSQAVKIHARQKAEIERLRSALTDLHDWMLEKAPEHYQGCGLWIDVEIILGRKKVEDFDDDFPNNIIGGTTKTPEKS